MTTPYQSNNGDQIQNRISWLMLIVFLISGFLLYKMFQKSVLEHGSYLAMAKNQYFISEENPSKRGSIYAEDITSDNGKVPLAINVEKYALNAIPKNIKDKNDAAQKLAPLLQIDKKDILNLIDNNKPYIPPIKHKLDKEVADKIIGLNLSGVYIQTENYRYYPETNLASQILGFVNADGKGNYGIEEYYNDQLRGRGGVVEGEKDTLGRLISITKQEEVQNGTDLVLTIERNVQYMVQQKLKESIDKYQADDGSVIIMEPSTGKIIAMAGYPDFNPNDYNLVPGDQQRIFLNPNTSLSFEPGSIFKPLVMGIALNEGKVEPDTEGVFSNSVTVQGYQINTAQNKAFGKETMTQVLENSDNVAMVWVADQLGSETMYKYLSDIGFGLKTGIDLPSEASGSILDLKKWRDINRATISFGQGISVTPMQVLEGISTIANNGIKMKPYVLDKMVRPEGESITKPVELKKIFSEETAKKLNGMLVSVVVRGHGKKAAVPGYDVAGKTGTAQIPKPSSEGGGYYEDQHIGSFAGFFPADNPKFAMIVKLTNPRNTEWAESSAAPTFGEIAKWVLSYYQIPPTH